MAYWRERERERGVAKRSGDEEEEGRLGTSCFFFAVSTEACFFGVVAAFALMMQFQRLPACRSRGEARLSAGSVLIRVCVLRFALAIPGPAYRGRGTGGDHKACYRKNSHSCHSHFSLTPAAARRLPQRCHGNLIPCLRKAKPIYCGVGGGGGGGEVEDGGVEHGG